MRKSSILDVKIICKKRTISPHGIVALARRVRHNFNTMWKIWFQFLDATFFIQIWNVYYLFLLLFVKLRSRVLLPISWMMNRWISNRKNDSLIERIRVWFNEQWPINCFRFWLFRERKICGETVDHMWSSHCLIHCTKKVGHYNACVGVRQMLSISYSRSKMANFPMEITNRTSMEDISN